MLNEPLRQSKEIQKKFCQRILNRIEKNIMKPFVSLLKQKTHSWTKVKHEQNFGNI